MITIHDSEMTLTIANREALIKAIADAMIWKAHAGGDRESDNMSMIILARLIGQLVILEE